MSIRRMPYGPRNQAGSAARTPFGLQIWIDGSQVFAGWLFTFMDYDLECSDEETWRHETRRGRNSHRFEWLMRWVGVKFRKVVQSVGAQNQRQHNRPDTGKENQDGVPRTIAEPRISRLH